MEELGVTEEVMKAVGKAAIRAARAKAMEVCPDEAVLAEVAGLTFAADVAFETVKLLAVLGPDSAHALCEGLRGRAVEDMLREADGLLGGE